MFWSAIAHLVALRIDLITARGRADGAKDLEIAVLRRRVRLLERRRPRLRLARCERLMRALLVAKLHGVTAGRRRHWSRSLVLVTPETVLRGHRQGFRLVWRQKSRAATPASRLPRETMDLIRQMGRDNPLRGADRIRGELLKLDLRVSKHTIQRYLRQARPSRPPGQA